MTELRWFLLFAVFGIACVACASRPYVLPSADGGPEPSPPSLEGRIGKVGPGEITVEVNGATGKASDEIPVRVTTTTEIFTVYGGYVRPSDLVAGLRVRVWFARPSKPRHDKTEDAAAIMIASKDPKDDWP